MTFRSIFFLILTLNFAKIDAKIDVFYPKLWLDVPSSIDEFPLINNSRIIDPWLYPHRLGLYKILIEITTPLMPFCSSSNASNILFALPSQFSWQFESNRLFTNGTLKISSKSWWASANYYLSVIPFLAAVDVGLISSKNFQIVRIEDFCTTIDECFTRVPKSMFEWRRFFLKVQNQNFSTTTINDEILDREFLEPLWAANIASIEESLPLIEEKVRFLPSSVERFFGSAWARLLRLISMTRKNTNLYETLKNQRRFLPRRMLTENDLTCRSNDFTPPVHRSLSILFSFHFEWLNFIEKIWTKLTCNYQGRRNAQRILETMGKSKFIAASYFLRAFFSTTILPCDSSVKNDL